MEELRRLHLARHDRRHACRRCGASFSQAGGNNLLLHTVDAQYENGPIGAYAAYLGAFSDSDDTGSVYDAGILLQASYLLTSKWEVFGRYEYMSIDSAHGSGSDGDFQVITAGVNYYWKKHSAKFTVDMMYLPNGSPVNDDAAGILDPDANDTQIVFRGQFQLLLESRAQSRTVSARARARGRATREGVWIMSDVKRIAGVVLLGGLVSGLCASYRGLPTPPPNRPSRSSSTRSSRWCAQRRTAQAESAPTKPQQQQANVQDADGDVRRRDPRRRPAQPAHAGPGFHRRLEQGQVHHPERGRLRSRSTRNFQFQARYVLNNRAEDAPTEEAGRWSTESGFEISRVKFAFEGNVFGPDTKYKFQWDAGSNGGHNGNVTLEEAYVMHRLGFAPDLWIKGGQFKDPTFHEELTSSRRLLAVDRSLANEVLGGGQTDYIQGIGIIWDDGPEGLPLRAEAGFTDGPNSDNTNFVDGGGDPIFDLANPDFGLYGRAEYLVFGDWKDYQDFTTLGNVQDTLVLGAGVFYSQRGDDERPVPHVRRAVRVQQARALRGVLRRLLRRRRDRRIDVQRRLRPAGGLPAQRPVGGLRPLLAGQSRYPRHRQRQLSRVHRRRELLRQRPRGEVHARRELPARRPPSNEPQIGVLDPDADDQQFVFRGQFQLLL